MKKRQTDEETVARLLDKFMAGETSLDEERLLAGYFSGGSVRREWLPYREMFAWFGGGMPLRRPARRPFRRPLRRLWAAVAAVAAVALIVAGAALWGGESPEGGAGAGAAGECSGCVAALAVPDSAEAVSVRAADSAAVRPPRPAAPVRVAAPRRVRYEVAAPKPLLAETGVAQGEADSLAEAWLREMALRQALAVELVEALGALQADAADSLAEAVAEGYGDDEIVF